MKIDNSLIPVLSFWSSVFGSIVGAYFWYRIKRILQKRALIRLAKAGMIVEKKPKKNFNTYGRK